MNEKAGCTAPAVVFGAALFVAFLARAVVQLLLTNPEAMAEGLLPVPLATRAADSASGLDFPRNDVAAAAVGSALDDTEGSAAKRKKSKVCHWSTGHMSLVVVMDGCNLWVCWREKSLCSGIEAKRL